RSTPRWPASQGCGGGSNTRSTCTGSSRGGRYAVRTSATVAMEADQASVSAPARAAGPEVPAAGAARPVASTTVAAHATPGRTRRRATAGREDVVTRTSCVVVPGDGVGRCRAVEERVVSGVGGRFAVGAGPPHPGGVRSGAAWWWARLL